VKSREKERAWCREREIVSVCVRVVVCVRESTCVCERVFVFVLESVR